jgi:ubiquinone biosynthesis protein UbiJ
MTKTKREQYLERQMRKTLKSQAPGLTIEQAIRAITKDIKYLYSWVEEAQDHVQCLEPKVETLWGKFEKLEKG